MSFDDLENCFLVSENLVERNLSFQVRLLHESAVKLANEGSLVGRDFVFLLLAIA